MVHVAARPLAIVRRGMPMMYCCSCVVGLTRSAVLHPQVRKWKMLGRHHGDSSAKQKESEPGCQSWGLHASPLLTSPVVMECSICSGPYIGYTLEDSWQPRQRTQARSAFLRLIITAKNHPLPLRQLHLFFSGFNAILIGTLIPGRKRDKNKNKAQPAPLRSHPFTRTSKV